MGKTPKEYAEELVKEYRSSILSFLSDKMKDKNAKQCAIIAVERETTSLMWLNLLCNFNNPMKHTIEQKITELKQVKTEIENL